MQNNSNEDIKVSVLCTAYNHEKYIREALEGFVKQKTNFRYEVLIHDDASTDRTADIIREYAEKFPDLIKPIFQKENQYSKGVDIYEKYLYPRVKGKYVAYCEGDDYWTDEHKLQKQFDVMEQNPNCSFCTHKVHFINEDGTLNNGTSPSAEFSTHGGLQDKKEMARRIWSGRHPFHTCSYFMRFDCIYECQNYDYIDYFNGDQALLRTAINFGDFWYINEEMSCHRLFSVGSWTSRMRIAPYELKRKFKINCIRGDILYDKISNRKFHDYINKDILRSIFSIAIGDMNEYNVPFIKTYWGLLDEFDISRSQALRSLDLKDGIKFFLLSFVPKLYIWLKNLRDKFRPIITTLN